MSPLSIKRLPDGSLLAVYNPIPALQWPPGNRKRRVDRRQNAALLGAHAQTARRAPRTPSPSKTTLPAAIATFSIFPAKDGVLLSYCAGGPNDGSCLNRLRIRKIRYEELPAEA